MKKNLLVATLLGALVLAACKNETQNGKTELQTPAENQLSNVEKGMPEIACFRYVSEKDTILLQMEKIDTEVAGTLSYNYFEKDKNDGTFEGSMVGDTLFATYTFGAEGRTSVREIMFLKNGTRLLEGFGEIERGNGKMQFKKNTKFTFNTLMPLQQVDCDSI
jgi:hypothetical protein